MLAALVEQRERSREVEGSEVKVEGYKTDKKILDWITDLGRKTSHFSPFMHLFLALRIFPLH